MAAASPRVRVVIQARTSSSRLPAKVLLPIAGVPIAMLVAERFRRFGFDAVVATSVDPTDDVLAAELERRGLAVIRGSLDNVLSRFGDATADLADSDICVRLTADNVFPDGGFLRRLVEEFVAARCEYLNNAQTLPYGLGAELFTVGALRRAVAEATTEYDLEHVTPWIKRNCACRTSTDDFGFGNVRALRCTIDTLADYVAVCALFRAVPDPVAADFRELTAALIALRATEAPAPTGVANTRPALVLGTAQLGMNYGRVNRTGRPSLDDAVAIVRKAANLGVSQFDTARVYGESEKVVGLAARKDVPFPITAITKLAPFPPDAGQLSERVLVGLVEASVYRSLFELQTARLPVLLLHRVSQMADGRGAAWERLLRFRADGQIGKLGASVQSPAELRSALEHPEIEHVQLPFNVLDRRWDGLFAGDRADQVTVHVRSAFLQGLLTSDDEANWPKVEGVDAGAVIGKVGELTARFGRESRMDFCLAFARAAPWVDGVVVGMETAAQLDENVRLFARPPLSADQYEDVRAAFAALPDELLDPARWR